MTAFVRLSNKKHLQHASRHAELHFSDGLCIMAHSPKAFLLTFHLLVRKSHYQHKMNFLKLEAYPLLARIRQLLPVLGQCLMYFIAAVFLLVASNAALTGSLHGLLGKASHTALGAVPLAAFLCLYRNNHRDLALGFVLWLILSIPPITTTFLETKPLSTLDIAENNVWAMTQAVLLIAGTGLTGLIRHRAVRFSAAALMTCCWILAFLPIASFLVYLIGFDALLTPDIVLALAQTHPNEAWEYLTFMGPFMMGVVALACLTLLALSVAAFKKRNALPLPAPDDRLQDCRFDNLLSGGHLQFQNTRFITPTSTSGKQVASKKDMNSARRFLKNWPKPVRKVEAVYSYS